MGKHKKTENNDKVKSVEFNHRETILYFEIVKHIWSCWHQNISSHSSIINSIVNNAIAEEADSKKKEASKFCKAVAYKLTATILSLLFPHKYSSMSESQSTSKWHNHKKLLQNYISELHDDLMYTIDKHCESNFTIIVKSNKTNNALELSECWKKCFVSKEIAVNNLLIRFCDDYTQIKEIPQRYDVHPDLIQLYESWDKNKRTAYVGSCKETYNIAELQQDTFFTTEIFMLYRTCELMREINFLSSTHKGVAVPNPVAIKVDLALEEEIKAFNQHKHKDDIAPAKGVKRSGPESLVEEEKILKVSKVDYLNQQREIMEKSIQSRDKVANAIQQLKYRRFEDVFPNIETFNLRLNLGRRFTQAEVKSYTDQQYTLADIRTMTKADLEQDGIPENIIQRIVMAYMDFFNKDELSLRGF